MLVNNASIAAGARALDTNPEDWDRVIAVDLRAKIRAAGLWLPQLPPEHGGLGQSHEAMVVLYKEMNRSIFGPVCFNCAVLDDGQ